MVVNTIIRMITIIIAEKKINTLILLLCAKRYLPLIKCYSLGTQREHSALTMACMISQMFKTITALEMDNHETSSGDKVLKILISIHVQLQIQSFGRIYILTVQVKLVLRKTCYEIFEWFEMLVRKLYSFLAKYKQLLHALREYKRLLRCLSFDGNSFRQFNFNSQGNLKSSALFCFRSTVWPR